MELPLVHFLLCADGAQDRPRQSRVDLRRLRIVGQSRGTGDEFGVQATSRRGLNCRCEDIWFARNRRRPSRLDKLSVSYQRPFHEQSCGQLC